MTIFTTSTPPCEVVGRFLEQFRRIHWPSGKGVPDISYDPRSLAPEPRDRASLHAKCIIVDALSMFVSSANFTEAGQEKKSKLAWLCNRLWLRSGYCDF